MYLKHADGSSCRNLPNLISNLLNEPAPARSAGSVILCNLITATLNLQYFSQANLVTSAYANKASSISEIPTIPSEDGKMDALLCLSLLIKRVPSLRLFSRLWPHLVELLSDSRLHSSGVRCLALEGLIESLECATTIAVKGKGEKEADSEEEECVAVISDTRFLNEFILPSLSVLTQDSCVDVRIALAQCLPRLTIVCSRRVCHVSYRPAALVWLYSTGKYILIL